MLPLIALGAFVLACLVNVIYWKPRFNKAKAEAEAQFNKLSEQNRITESELGNYKKSLFRAVDIHGQLKAENIMLKEKLEAEKQWKNFLMQES